MRHLLSVASFLAMTIPLSLSAGTHSASVEDGVATADIATARSKYDVILGPCQVVNNPITNPKSAKYSLDPIGWVTNYFSSEGKPLSGAVVSNVVLAPKHGKLEVDSTSDSIARVDYVYYPNPKYYGLDKVAIKVEAQGKVLLVRYTISVTYTDPENGTCPITSPGDLYPPKSVRNKDASPYRAKVLPNNPLGATNREA